MSEGSYLGLFYGEKSNTYLLKWYGFVLDNNKYDSLSFRLVSDEMREKYNMKDNIYGGYISTYTDVSVSDGIRRIDVGCEYRSKMHTLNMVLLSYIRYSMYSDVYVDIDMYCNTIHDIHDEMRVLLSYKDIYTSYIHNHMRKKDEYISMMDKYKDRYDIYSILRCEYNHMMIAYSHIDMIDMCIDIVDRCIQQHIDKISYKDVYTHVSTYHAYDRILSISYYIEQVYYVLH